jgi:hypothetical protein
MSVQRSRAYLAAPKRSIGVAWSMVVLALLAWSTCGAAPSLAAAFWQEDDDKKVADDEAPEQEDNDDQNEAKDDDDGEDKDDEVSDREGEMDNENNDDATAELRERLAELEQKRDELVDKLAELTEADDAEEVREDVAKLREEVDRLLAERTALVEGLRARIAQANEDKAKKTDSTPDAEAVDKASRVKDEAQVAKAAMLAELQVRRAALEAQIAKQSAQFRERAEIAGARAREFENNRKDLETRPQAQRENEPTRGEGDPARLEEESIRGEAERDRQNARQRFEQFRGDEVADRISHLERMVVELREQLEQSRGARPVEPREGAREPERSRRAMAERQQDRARAMVARAEEVEARQRAAFEARQRAAAEAERREPPRRQPKEPVARERDAVPAGQQRANRSGETAFAPDESAGSTGFDVVELANSYIDAIAAVRLSQVKLEHQHAAANAGRDSIIPEGGLKSAEIAVDTAQRKLKLLRTILEIALDDARSDLTAAEEDLNITADMHRQGELSRVRVIAREREVARARSRLRMLEAIGAEE